MTEPKLGQLIEGDAERDAIHVAIIPAAAGERLLPGAKVGRNEDGEYVTGGEVLGIVDPFLSGFVDLKERFWLFLLPNTVTGMRHHWQHPAFDGEPAVQAGVGDVEWITDFAAEHGMSYDDFLDAARDLVEQGEYLMANESQYKYNDERSAKWPEFWKRFKSVTGLKAGEYEDQHPFFTCSC